MKDSNGIAIVDMSLSAAEVARDISQACESSGCFHLINHTVPPTLLADVMKEMDKFFSLPLEDKQKCFPLNPSDDRGYSAFATQNIAAFMGRRNEPNDPVEKFAYSSPTPLVDAYTSPNVWPSQLPNFRSTMEDYFFAVKGLTKKLFDLFALALKIDPEYFSTRTTTAPNCVKLNHYPAMFKAAGRFGEHTDSCSFTILFIDSTPNALKIRMPEKQEWIPVNPQLNGLFVNLGDVLQRWTNDKWLATPHRVDGQGNATDRKSVAFFVMLSSSAEIECFPSCVGDGAKYEPITFYDFVQKKIEGLQIGLK
ncbi:oxidoreductase [Thraustotheca clavata]|uniref:Oxidoreductase n=1 Tax=Thraustotheca clavata TaxID=74557 RepID=A0A1V9ZKD3_9STRA|nr:oxidoreductase [Thraustotheca clavata]